MAEKYDNEMKGVLFPNKERTGDAHPDYRGQCKINGVEMWISGWKKKSKIGDAYLSMSFSAKDDAKRKPAPKPTPPQSPPDLLDESEIPF